MNIIKLVLGALDINTYIVVSENGQDAFIIDPAVESPSVLESIRGLSVPYIVNTHGHFDHIGGNTAIKYAKNSKVVIHSADAPMLVDAQKNLSGLFSSPVLSAPADILIENEGFSLTLAEMEFSIFEVPGHTQGSIALYNSKEGVLFGGDLLFANSVGRTDFPGGSTAALKKSVDKILQLPDDTHVYPGHEDEFTLGEFRPVYKHILENGLF